MSIINIDFGIINQDLSIVNAYALPTHANPSAVFLSCSLHPSLTGTLHGRTDQRLNQSHAKSLAITSAKEHANKTAQSNFT
jgi:hypothetical protein